MIADFALAAFIIAAICCLVALALSCYWRAK
jgi:hypothetical protein